MALTIVSTLHMSAVNVALCCYPPEALSSSAFHSPYVCSALFHCQPSKTKCRIVTLPPSHQCPTCYFPCRQGGNLSSVVMRRPRYGRDVCDNRAWYDQYVCIVVVVHDTPHRRCVSSMQSYVVGTVPYCYLHSYEFLNTVYYRYIVALSHGTACAH